MITPSEERKMRRQLVLEKINGAKFNQELGEVVEQGSIQVFDCPPLLYSPPNVENEAEA